VPRSFAKIRDVLEKALKTNWRPAAAWGGAVLALDLATKAAALNYLDAWEPRPVIDGFFHLILRHNTGLVFSFLAGEGGPRQALMTALAVLLLLTFIYFFIQTGLGDRSHLAALGLILGGALGNIHDRLRWGAVVDFLDFHWRGYHWPAFNMADLAICLGAGLLGLGVWRGWPASPEGRG